MNDSITQHLDRLIEEGPIGMTAAARLLGSFRSGKPCHTSTVTRWCLSGVKLTDGRVVRLEHFRTAGRLMTTRPALLRFLANQQVNVPATPDARSPAARRRASEDAEKKLTEAGI